MCRAIKFTKQFLKGNQYGHNIEFEQERKKKPVKKVKKLDPRIEKPSFFGTEKQVATLTDLAKMVSDGCKLKKIADYLVEHGNSNQKKIGNAISIQLSKGQPIGLVMHVYFGELAGQAILNGEQNSKLSQGFIQAIEIIRITSAGIGDLVKALTKPTLFLFGTFVAVLLLGDFAWPMIQKMVPQADWPGITSVMFAIWSFLDAFFWNGVISIIVLTMLFKPLLGNISGKTRNVLDKAFIFKQYRYAMTSQFLYNLSNSLKSGRSIKSSLDFTEKKANRYLKWKIRLIRKQLTDSKEDNFAYLLDVGLLEPALFSRMKMLSESTNEPSHLLESAAKAHSQRLYLFLERTKYFGSALATFVMIGLALMFLLSIILFQPLTYNSHTVKRQ